LHPRHIFAANGTVTGVIDWGDAIAGDPLYDFGRLLQAGFLERDLTHGLRLVTEARAAYEDTTPPDLTSRVAIYAIAFVLRAITKGSLSGTPLVAWFKAQERALLTFLSLANAGR
jgi:aminoglycoside phosphotransferase (APT) family kinase protein